MYTWLPGEGHQVGRKGRNKKILYIYFLPFEKCAINILSNQIKQTQLKIVKIYTKSFIVVIADG